MVYRRTLFDIVPGSGLPLQPGSVILGLLVGSEGIIASSPSLGRLRGVAGRCAVSRIPQVGNPSRRPWESAAIVEVRHTCSNSPGTLKDFP